MSDFLSLPKVAPLSQYFASSVENISGGLLDVVTAASLGMTTTSVALSTVFTVPASCSTSWSYEAQTYNGVSSGILLQNMFVKFSDNECFPPGFANEGRGSASQIFSPGACPYGYVTQLNSISGGVTTATCCSEYVCLLKVRGASSPIFKGFLLHSNLWSLWLPEYLSGSNKRCSACRRV